MMDINHGHRSGAALPLAAATALSRDRTQAGLPAAMLMIGAAIFAIATLMAGYMLLRPSHVSFAWALVAAGAFLASAAIGVILLHCQRSLYIAVCALALLVGIMLW